MLKVRLIPKLQLRRSKIGNGSRYVLVTTTQFDRSHEIGDPVSQAKIYEAQAADELIFLDLDASKENRPPAIEVINKVAEEVFMPITVGGGVNTLEDFRMLLANGADKVSINAAAVENPRLITLAADTFGSQCVVVSIDYKKTITGEYEVFIRNGKVGTGLNPVLWAQQVECLGAGELLITSIDNDGLKAGLDLSMTSKISQAVAIPVITSGGCGLASDFVAGLKEGRASAVAAGTFFCVRDQPPMQTRSHIQNAGIPIRIHI